MNLHDATLLAERVGLLFAAKCARVETAGSVRRGKAEVSDLDLVALLSGGIEPRFAAARLDGHIVQLLRDGTLLADPFKRKMGAKSKRFLVPADVSLPMQDWANALKQPATEKVAVDFCAADELNFGYRLALSTGNADWNTLLVTAREKGGLKPNGLVLVDGYLYRMGARVAVPSEADFFRAMELPFVAPESRDKSRALNLIGDLRRKGAA